MRTCESVIIASEGEALCANEGLGWRGMRGGMGEHGGPAELSIL